MKPFRLMHTYPLGAEIQRRDGNFDIKTESGLIRKARHIAAIDKRVIGGGEDLQPGWKVMHRDMSTFGTPEHDRPKNLVVIKQRTFKFKIMARPLLFLPKTKPLFQPSRKIVITKREDLSLAS